MGFHGDIHRLVENPSSERPDRHETASSKAVLDLRFQPLDHDRDIVLHEHRDYRIRLADSHGHRSKASLLINRMYSWRGYDTSTAGTTSSLNLSQITLVASRAEHVFGTLTVGLEHAGSGLQVDQLYKDEIDAIRSQGRKICEFVKLAVDPEEGSKDALAALFHLAFIYGCKIQRCDDIVIEVNPRHRVFYKRMLGFVQAGPERICERVGAPAVLMRLPGTYAGEQIDRYGGHQASARSLYPYFFSKREEDGICQRLRRMA